MLEIERLGWLKPRYALRYENGHAGTWSRRRFHEAMAGEVDGERYELHRDGRKHFLLVRSGRELAAADAGKRGRWTVCVGERDYELRRKSHWRSQMVLRSGGSTIGSIRRGRGGRGKMLCELPPELSPPIQAFIAFVVLTLWNRAAASSGAAAVAVSGSS